MGSSSVGSILTGVKASRTLSAPSICFVAIAALAQQGPPPDEPSLEELARRFVPNYALQMLSPVDGTDETPRLVRRWDRFPLRIVVLDREGQYSEAYFRAILRAANQWTTATRGLPGGGVSFVCQHGPSAEGAHIVVRLSTNDELDGYGGFTRVQPEGWVYVQLSATRTSGKPTEEWLLERVATHELGHALGIDGHSADGQDVMSTELESRDITVADLNTLRIAYRGTFHPRPPKPPRRNAP